MRSQSADLPLNMISLDHCVFGLKTDLHLFVLHIDILSSFVRAENIRLFGSFVKANELWHLSLGILILAVFLLIWYFLILYYIFKYIFSMILTYMRYY